MIHEKEFISLKENDAGDSSGVFYSFGAGKPPELALVDESAFF